MNIQDPYMHGADPGNIGSINFDYVVSSYESKVCEQLIESAWASKETEDVSNAVDPNSLNSRNAGAAKEIYSPLGPDAMRLLKLHRGKGKIQCSVMVVQEGSPPEYEALSYVWGSTDDLQIIKLDGLDYFVTRNLFEVLLRFRKLDKDRLLWIDALVINQSDLAERGREVTKMLDRYSGAAGTIVWLGVPLENAQYGRMDIIAAMKFLCQADLIVPSEHETGDWVPIKQAVEAIFCSRYWTRAWTVQEIMYSDNVTLHYGSMSLPMDDFLRYVDVNYHVAEASPFKSIVVGDGRVALRPGYGRQKRYLRVPSWLGCYLRHRVCTNPKDCVFAYYGCFSPEARKYIVPDYERSPFRISFDITQAWIVSERTLDFLLEVGCRESCWSRPKEPDEYCMPTWIPSYFGKQTNCTGRVVAGPDVPQVPPPWSTPIVRFDGKRNAMYVKGVLLGTVEKVGEPYSDSIFTLEPLMSLLKHHIMRVGGKIGDLDRGLKELARVHCDRTKLLEAMKKHPEIVKVMEREFVPAEESLSEGVERQLRITECTSSARTAFSYKQWRESRFIQTSKVDVPFGLGTRGLETGDQLFVVVGCSTPLILRPIKDFHIVIGNSKVFSFADGIFLQGNLEMFPPGIFIEITLR